MNKHLGLMASYALTIKDGRTHAGVLRELCPLALQHGWYALLAVRDVWGYSLEDQVYRGDRTLAMLRVLATPRV